MKITFSKKELELLKNAGYSNEDIKRYKSKLEWSLETDFNNSFSPGHIIFSQGVDLRTMRK